MAAKIAPSLRASLERLKHAGAVNGLALGWRRQLLVNLLPYSEFRGENVLHLLLDAREHYAQGGRSVQTLWFGFEGVHLLAAFEGDTTLILLHSRALEVDFLSQTAITFLSDSQLLINAAINPSLEDGRDTQRLNEDPHSPEGHGHTNLISKI